ncbi:hypothetical protein [Streptomyces sp. DH10]|uniref:hypothetical protein n=1 Tax=Streptomyces sp. DH10 TaxID=3040121 RepID=UPI0024417783|nr:hypothetical protein [Streptomyces sp. DH10]MDG9711821.1 hypothetical protein [Streptomyces sp. DH10]
MSGPTMTATVDVTVPGPVHMPVHAGASRSEPATDVGLPELVHALQARLEALERTVSGEALRREAFAEAGSRPEFDGAPGAVEAAAGGRLHTYRRS